MRGRRASGAPKIAAAAVCAALASCNAILGNELDEPRPTDGGAPVPPVTPPPRSSPYRTAVLASRPILYLRLGESTAPVGGSVLEEVSGGRMGKILGPIGSGVNGALPSDADTAFLFSGEGSIDLGDMATFPDRAAFSVELWVRPSSVNTYVVANTIFSGGASRGWMVVSEESGIVFRRKVDNLPKEVHAPAPSRERYGYYVFVYDGATLRGYMDGASLGAGVPDDRPFEPHGAKLYVGAAGAGAGSTFAGQVDEVAIYDRALSAAEVASHKAASSSP